MRVNDYDSHKWYVLDIFFIVTVLVLMTYFIITEIYSIILEGLDYFKDVWNYLDIISWSLNIAFIASDLNGINPLKVRPLGTMAVAIIWMKLFYFLRLFNPTSAMIRMISEVAKDIRPFGTVVFLAMMAWGNVFFILDINDYSY